MRADRRVSLKVIGVSAVLAIIALHCVWMILSALSSGRIEGRSGHVYVRALDASAFEGALSIYGFVLLVSVAAVVYLLWVRPRAVRSEVILSRRLAVRNDLDTAVRRPLEPSTDG